MFDGLSGRGSSPGIDPHDPAAARLDAQRQAVRDMADWLEKAPDCARGSFCTLTLNLSFPPSTGTGIFRGMQVIRASCQWTASVAPTPGPVAPPAGKTSAFAPSSRFTLLGDQFYEASGTTRGEDTISQNRACADARKRARHQAMESAAKAGLCDRDDFVMRMTISFSPPAPALLGGGRYGISGFEAVCEWNLVIEAVAPEPAEASSPGAAGAAASGSLF